MNKRLEQLREQYCLKACYVFLGMDNNKENKSLIKGAMTMFFIGFDSSTAEHEKIIKELEGALKIAALGETQFDGVEAMHYARQALQKLKEFRGGE